MPAVLLVAGGMAIVVSPLTTAVMNAAPEGKSGAASGISNAASRLAGVLAIAIFGATAGVVFGWSGAGGCRASASFRRPAMLPRGAVEAAFLSAYSAAMIFGAIWCFIAAAISFVTLKGTAPPKKRRPAANAPAR